MPSRQNSPLRSSPSRRAFSPSRSTSPNRGMLRSSSFAGRAGRSYVPSRTPSSGGFFDGETVEVINGSGNWIMAKVIRNHNDDAYDVQYQDGFEDREVEVTRIRCLQRTSQPSLFRQGDRVEAKYHGTGKYYPGVVSEINDDGTYNIRFDYGETFAVTRDAIVGEPQNGNSFGLFGQDRRFGSNMNSSYGNGLQRQLSSSSFGTRSTDRFETNNRFGGFRGPSDAWENNNDNNNSNGKWFNNEHNFPSSRYPSFNNSDRNERFEENRNNWHSDFARGSVSNFPRGWSMMPYNGEFGRYGDHYSHPNFAQQDKVFSVGSLVEVQLSRNGNRWLSGRITVFNPEDKSYNVELEDGTSESNLPERSIRWRDEAFGSGGGSEGLIRRRGFANREFMMRGRQSGFPFGFIQGGWGSSGGYNSFGGGGFSRVDEYGMYGPRNVPSMVSGSPSETGFGVFHAREAHPEQWCPIVAYIYDIFQEYFFRYQSLSQRRQAGFEQMYGSTGERNHFSSPGYLPPGCEVTIVPSSEWCEFSGGEPTMGRVVWNGWRVSCPFFFRPRPGSPRNFAVKIIYYVRAIMVAEVTFEVFIPDQSPSQRNNLLGVGGPGETMSAVGAGVGSMSAMNQQYQSQYPAPRGYGGGSSVYGDYGQYGSSGGTAGQQPSLDEMFNFFDVSGGDRRVPMFRSIYVIPTDRDEGFETLLGDTVIALPGMSIRRRDPNSKISETYLRSSDRVQLVCCREGSRQYSPETYSDLTTLQKSLVTPEERVRKMVLTFSDYPMIPPQEIERLPGCNYSFNPEYTIYRWLQLSDGRQMDLRQRLYEAARGISRAFMEVSDRPIPFGMILLAGGSDLMNLGGFSGSDQTTPWNLFFMCEDHASQTMRDEFAHEPVQTPFDPEFLVHAYPFLKATVAILMYCRFTSNENVPFFPTPFNVYGLSKRFDENMLLDMANFYDNQAREYRPTYYQKMFDSGYGSGYSSQNWDQRDPDFRNSSPYRKRFESDFMSGPFDRLSSGGDFLSYCVQYAESALSSIHQWGLGRSARRVRSRLDEIAPTWLQQCDMRPMEFDLKVWWVSPLSYDLRWKNLHMMVCPPGTPGYQQYLQLTGGGGVYNGRSAEPFSLDYQNSYFYQQQGRHLSNAYRGPMTEISGRLMSEVGVRDFSVANEVAMRLSQEGCETWDDVLRLDEFVGSKGNYNDVKWFLRDIGLPVVVASKLMLLSRNYRERFSSGSAY